MADFLLICFDGLESSGGCLSSALGGDSLAAESTLKDSSLDIIGYRRDCVGHKIDGTIKQ